jgi:uncharacterized protein (TIGR03086 family)
VSETSERYRNLAGRLTDRVRAVPDDAWERPAPCEGWVARDVVRHLVDVAGFFLGPAGLPAPAGPSVDDDPIAAWEGARDAVQSALDDPDVAGREIDSPMGKMTLDQMMQRFGIPDVLVHTWDLSRAAGLDETLDPAEVERVYAQMEPFDAMIRQGNAFGPRVEVPDDADPQTRLIAFTGRQP